MLGSCLGNQGGLRCGNTLSLVGAATSNIFVATNVLLRQTRVCYNKHVCYDKTCLLSRQKYGCQDKTFVPTNIFLLRQKHNFVTTKLLPGQAFVATNMCCNNKTKNRTKQKTSFLACLWQRNFCHDKHMFVVTKIFCSNKYNFVATKVLSRQAYFCHDKRCVLS